MAESNLTCYAGGEPATATCTTCQKPICNDHTQMGQPFISAGDLLRTAARTPALLFGPPLDEVPYCPSCRETLAEKRSTEQLKVLVVMLLLVALVGFGVFQIIT